MLTGGWTHASGFGAVGWVTPHDAQALRDERDALTREHASLRAQLEQALAEIGRLRRTLDEAERGGKRQAAPCSRNTPKANPKPPVRKAGAQYGVRASRPVQGRHPLQTSDALGAAHVQVGPEAIALAAQMTKELGALPCRRRRGVAPRL